MHKSETQSLSLVTEYQCYLKYTYVTKPPGAILNNGVTINAPVGAPRVLDDPVQLAIDGLPANCGDSVVDRSGALRIMLCQVRLIVQLNVSIIYLKSSALSSPDAYSRKELSLAYRATEAAPLSVIMALRSEGEQE